MKFHKILCPVDFSAASADAARYAAGLAHRHEAELTLLHVAPDVADEFAMSSPTASRLSEFTTHRDQAANQALEAFPSDPPLSYRARRIVGAGDAASGIVHLARSEGHDLIVMSTHGMGAIRRWLLVGSVTTKVLHTTETPVIVAPAFGDFPPLLRRIVCAVDLGPASRRVLCTAAGMAREMGSALTVVHAVAGFGNDFVDAEWRTTLSSRLATTLTGLMEETQAVGDLVIEPGDPHRVVAKTAERGRADLVVIGRGVHTGVLGRLRAQAYEIIRNSPCPVLSV